MLFLIRNSSNAGMYGVTLTLSGAQNATTTSGQDGSYLFTGLSNGTYTVTPSYSSGWGFTPPNRSVPISGADVSGQDFAGAFAGGTVSGYVKNSSGTGMANVTVALTGTGPAAPVTLISPLIAWTVTSKSSVTSMARERSAAAAPAVSGSKLTTIFLVKRPSSRT